MPAVVGQEGDAIFAALVTGYAPGWLASLAAIGLVAAAMSTIDTCANVMALSIGYDMLRIHQRSGTTTLSRWITIGTMVASCLFALGTTSLWDLFYLSGGILSTAVAFPVAAVFLPGLSPRAVVWSSRAGFAGTAIAYLLEAHGPLASLEPAWLAGSGLGFILWGLAAAALGFLIGHSWKGARMASIS